MPESERSDTRAANWGKRVKKWKRWADEMRADAGAMVTFPADFETPPHRRPEQAEADPIAVEGVWHNDGTAGVGIWCARCDNWLPDGEDSPTGKQVADAIAAHRESESHRRIAVTSK